MTTIGLQHDVGASDIVRKTLLSSGLVASLLYGGIDLLAGLRYEGYSFYSQTISELGAIGAPRPAFLAPLFLTYCLLMVVFALAVLREGKGRLRIVGALLLAYMAVGSGTSFFPMHVRGTGTLAGDMPHIVSGLAAVAVMLVTIGAASPALGTRFRNFSWAMMAVILVFGALTVPPAVKLARGEPTPGLGLIERIAYYGILVWVAALSVALVRRAGDDHAGGRP